MSPLFPVDIVLAIFCLCEFLQRSSLSLYIPLSSLDLFCTAEFTKVLCCMLLIFHAAGVQCLISFIMVGNSCEFIFGGRSLKIYNDIV